MKGHSGIWVALTASGVVAAVGSLPLYQVGSDRLLLLALPGMLVSMVVAGNVHAFSPALALFCAWLFWFAVLLLVRSLWRRSHGGYE